MKKWQIAALSAGLLLLIIVGVLLAAHFIRQSGESSNAYQVKEYVQEHWPMFDASYDEDTQALTLWKTADIAYDKACAYGGSVYEGELAPESFLPEIRSIGLDVLANCDAPLLSVTLLYKSSDGKTIFSVGSDGTVWTCWEREDNG